MPATGDTAGAERILRFRHAAGALTGDRHVYFFYYYPIGVDVASERRPWASWGLALTLTVVFVLSLPLASTNDVEWFRGVYRPAVINYWSPLTAVFLHGSWMHLAGNLLYLMVFAPALEGALGRVGLLLVFAGTGYLGNLTQGAWVLHTAPENALAGVVGASGAISGLLGLFLLRFPTARLRLAYWAFLPLQGINRTGVRELPAVVGLLLWVSMQVIFSLVQGNGGGTAYGAHLGGLAAGLLLAVSLGLPRRAATEVHLLRARRHLREGRPLAAIGHLERYLQRAPHDVEAWLELARALRVGGDRAHATRVYRRVVEPMTRTSTERATEVYLEARRADPTFHLPSEQQRKIAHWLEKTGRWKEAVTAHLDQARFHRDDPASVHSLARAATLLTTRLRDGRGAREVLEDARRRFPEHPLRDWIEGELARHVA